MTGRFSFAVALRRVYDSSPPEKPACFLEGERVLRPLDKGGGLYAFADEPAERVEIRCPGYLPALAEVRRGEVHFTGLFPGPDYCGPPGWRITRGPAPPGEILYWPDPGYCLRLLSWDREKGAARILAQPGFRGGTLLFARDGRGQAALIQEKEPPDLYYLGPLQEAPTGSVPQRVWAAKADETGKYTAVTPEGFPAGEPWRQGRDDLWVLEP